MVVAGLGVSKMLKVRITYVGDKQGEEELIKLVDHIYDKFECAYSSKEYPNRGTDKYIRKYFDFYPKEEDTVK